MIEYADVFGANLRRIREGKKISRKEFEQKTGIPAVTLAGYENAVRTPNFKNLVTIADTLQVTTDELLGRDKFLEREIEKKNLEYRFKRAEKIMTLLGFLVIVCKDGSVVVVFDDYLSDDGVISFSFSLTDNDKNIFVSKKEFVVALESMERQAIRENKFFKDVFLEKIFQVSKEKRQ